MRGWFIFLKDIFICVLSLKLNLVIVFLYFKICIGVNFLGWVFLVGGSSWERKRCKSERREENGEMRGEEEKKYKFLVNKWCFGYN